MNNFYVYSYRTHDEEDKPINCLVVFCPYVSIKKHIAEFKQQLRDYFLSHLSPDEIYVIGSDYNKDELLEFFGAGEDHVFDVIPHFLVDECLQSTYLFCFQEGGELEQVDANTIRDPDSIRNALSRGMVNIFNEREGLIIAQGSHHFVFSKGKHCDRFLRTGNVLIEGPEILFIAHQLLKFISKESYDTIYCDTSSINSLAFALVEVKRRFSPSFVLPQIQSFGSYDVFEKEQFKGARKSLFLISASTSGSIVKRMLTEKRGIEMSQLAVIYGHSLKKEYSSQVVCDLTYHAKENPDGIKPFTTYNVGRGERCALCAEGSAGVDVHGDVFLLEKPIIHDILLEKADAPKYLPKFIETFRSEDNGSWSALKCFHGEGSGDPSYELFIDIPSVLEEWPKDRRRCQEFFNRLQKYVRDYIPASVQYLVYLPDDGSKRLAAMIQEILAASKVMVPDERILPMNDIKDIDGDLSGVIVVVSSCIVMGKNLLYLSRALRKYQDSMSRVFFTAVNRTPYKGHSDFLSSNLGHGEFGGVTHRVVNVVETYCSNLATETPWHLELELAKRIQDHLEDVDASRYKEAIEFFKQREDLLNNCGKTNGLTNDLFYSHPSNEKPLKIRKGFVFQVGKSFEKHASQSMVYFIISSVLNHLRYSTDGNRQLTQTEYVRNLLAPANFNRFNDGIIQASILRASKPEEMRYDLSEPLSYQMRPILGDMIKNVRNEHGEGLTEFFHAIAIKKLRLTNGVLHDCIELLKKVEDGKGDMPVLMALVDYIEAKITQRTPVQVTFETIR